jgi:hypothetical protein
MHISYCLYLTYEDIVGRLNSDPQMNPRRSIFLAGKQLHFLKVIANFFVDCIGAGSLYLRPGEFNRLL